MQRLLFDFLFFSLGGTVGVVAMCILQAGRQSDRKMMELKDQLLEVYLDIKEAGLITLGNKVTTIATVIVPVYAVTCLVFQPILYRVYKKVEIK